MNRTRYLLFALGFLLFAQAAKAQFELSAGNFNATFVAQTAAGLPATAAGPPSPASPPPTSGQYAAVGEISGNATIRSTTTVFADRYPATSTKGFVLEYASFGGMFASGLPRFSLGDEITPPLVNASGVGFSSALPDPVARDANILAQARAYWRVKPVLPGESISPLAALPVTVLTSSTSSTTVTVASVPTMLLKATLLGRTVNSIVGTTLTLSGPASETITSSTTRNYVPLVPLPLGSVNVISAATNSTTVQFSGTAPPELVLGAVLLGQPVSRILGNTITLAGSANTTITSSTPTDITPATSYYYSPHSEKVYASQPGRVSIIWQTNLPNGSGNYELLTEEFAVSSTTARQTHTIYWTEGSFDAPQVKITDSRITTVSAAYNYLVPKAVAEEVIIPGYNPTTPNLTTLSFDRINGIGLLHAYNVEGRVLIEYLGNVRAVGNVYQSLGLDVVNIVRVAPVNNYTVYLGQEIIPHDGDTSLTPSPVFSTAQNAATYYGSSLRPDGTTAYFAERETGPVNDPDNDQPASTDAYNKAVFYWLEESDFSIKWPKFQDRYWLRWSPNLADYAHYTVDTQGSTAATGVSFTGGTLPQIVYQDDPAQAEARIDLTTQRLFVTFDPLANNTLNPPAPDQRNRALLKFTRGSKVWYVNLYSQAEGRQASRPSTATSLSASGTILTLGSTAGLEVGMVVTGPGIAGSARVLRIISSTQLEISQNLPVTNQTLILQTGTATQSSTLTGGPYGASVALDGNLTNFTHTDGTTAPTWWQMAWTANRAVQTVTLYNRPGYGERLRDITIEILDADLTTVLWTSPTLNPANSANSPATIPLDVAALTGAAVNGWGIRVRRTPPTNGDPNVLSLAEVVVMTTDPLPAATTLAYTVQADASAPIDAVATVGSRLEPPAGHENAGYVSRGTGYYPAGYLNPFVVGVSAANLGAIIPVNALPTDNVLNVRWFKKVVAPSADFQDLYVPGKWGRYTVSYPKQSVAAAGSQLASRYEATATRLQDGKILVVGGQNGTSYLASAEIFDPGAMTWKAAGSLTTLPRSNHTATLLNDGRVLVLGGNLTATTTTNDVQVYTPSTGVWSQAASMSNVRAKHTATLLNNGTVFVYGGFAGTTAIGIARLYTPAGNTWSSKTSGSARARHTATLLNDGTLLFIGGIAGSSYLNSVELYNPGTDSWTTRASLASARADHTATLLPNGTVLVTGGFNGTDLASAELYDPVANTWSAVGSLASGRSLHTASLLADGRVLVIGSSSTATASPRQDFARQDLEIYNPSKKTWITVDHLLTARVSHAAATLSDGRLLISGGVGSVGATEVINPLGWTSDSSTIVLAKGVGTDDLPPDEAKGNVYYQNDSAQTGYNPNEEHAIILGGRAYALRDDLNVTSGTNYTSQPFVLLAYTNSADKRPAIHAYKVLRTDAAYEFDYTSTAGTLLVKPYPLPLMPQPLVGTGVNRASKDLEIMFPDLPANDTVKPDSAYKKFTFQDRKGFTWVHRGPHNGGTPTLSMKLYYVSRAGFWIPGTGEPAVGTILPFLRNPARSGQSLNINAINANADGTPGQIDEPLTIVYRPAWPTDAPELRVGETLTLPKFGLPQVRGQKSAQVLYEQSIANAAPNTLLTKNSVTLHDPTREKTIALDDAAVGLTALPSSIKTSSYQGKTYFQTLPPHLQKRLYVDPLRGAKGTLVLLGTFHDEITGDDYLDLNLLTAADEALIKGLVPTPQGQNPVPGSDDEKWDKAIDALNTRVETFKPDPAQFGSYIVDTTKNQNVGENELARVTDPNTAVDSYAVTATGQGTGFVTMVFGNGNAFTPEGDPVQIQVFKIANQLYVGDLKVITSSNPLDEQVTLRHSSDFAGKPEDYDFEWRWATGAASAPQTYATVMTTRIGNPAALPTPTDKWVVVRDPGALKPTAAQYTAAGPAVPFTTTPPARKENVHPVVYALDAQGQQTNTIIDTVVITPTAVNSTTITVADSSGLRTGMTVTGDSLSAIATVTSIPNSTSAVLSLAPSSATAPLTFRALTYSDADIAAGYPSLVAKSSVGVNFSDGVPGSIVFSADLGSRDGFVLYVNGRAAVAYNAPTPLFTLKNSSSGLTSNGLSKQFSVEPSYFKPIANNTIEVAIYTTADANAESSLSFLLEAAQETDQVTSGTIWQPTSDPSDPSRKNTNTALIGGSTLNPFGGSQFVLNDRWFTMRYRPKASANNVLGTPWSRWMPPQFVEGWVKRVLAAINPFEQRVKDLGNNQVSTDVSVITQAGTRWEGDVALTLDNINDVGLIAIYETVLNRAKSMSIDANTNDPDTNNALILAAGYLNDLYTLLGNEAYADADNPTISIDDQSSITEVNTSRFSFEGQVANSLDEELALLRGRDDSVSPGVINAPAYNRLYWNYTHGINSGEAIYAINYNIKEKVGSSTANGVIDESDAQRMFPQGHGDAYGHYLTALTGYYRLLTNANFTWSPRAEAVTVLGLPVTVDFQDERKFAAAAGNIARTAQQVLALTYRQAFKDDPASGWEHYHDLQPVNTDTGVKSAQGLDEWASRSGQGALFHWAVANALIPDVDTYHTGVQKIDRTTVPEISELVSASTTFQTTIDNANAHLNPLGLSPGAIAFDLSPAEMQAGTSHFEQVYARSLRSLLNASGAFNQAAGMTRSLRDQQNQLDDYNAAIVQQEAAYVNQLIDLYGRPYSGDVGAGKLYAQGYSGPDLAHWFIVDRPNDLVDTSGSFTITLNEATELRTFTGSATTDLVSSFAAPNMVPKTVNVQASQWVQYNDVWKTGGLGSRPETGELQSSLQDAQQSWLALREAKNRLQKKLAEMKGAIVVFNDSVATHQKTLAELGTKQSEILGLERLVRDLDIAAQVTGDIAQGVTDLASGVAEGLPKVLGIASDTTSAARGAILTGAFATWVGLKATALSTTAASRFEQTKIVAKEQTLEYNSQLLGFSHEEVQLAYELDNIYRELITNANELMQLTLSHQSALQSVNNVLAKGSRILAEREVFRQRAAAIIQGYRTKDLGFRIFRNEALEQYRTLFDLASRYTYLAAKSYDYETGLLGTTQGQSVFAKIVASRSLGDLTNGTPQSTTSTLGDAGLAGTMAQLDAEFSVAKGRLGINNPDQYGTVFSLRGELFRIRTDAAVTSDDDAWQQTLEQHMVSNVLADADVATYCRNIKKPNGTPVPGIILPFSTTIQHGKNFFGLDYLPGDHNYTPSSFATKIYNVGIALPGYVGMDTYATGNMNAGAPASSDPNALGATPYAYLIPCGNDYMLAPPLGDTNVVRSWTVRDQALPLPYNLGANDFNSTQFFSANGTLSEQPWIIRKHQAFRMVSDPAFFYSSIPAEFTNSRLVGRSVWNGMWKLVIPAYTLHSNEQTGLDRFAASVRDIQLFLRTYSHSGN